MSAEKRGTATMAAAVMGKDDQGKSSRLRISAAYSHLLAKRELDRRCKRVLRLERQILTCVSGRSGIPDLTKKLPVAYCIAGLNCLYTHGKWSPHKRIVGTGGFVEFWTLHPLGCVLYGHPYLALLASNA